jgi:hypothetical protein
MWQNIFQPQYEKWRWAGSVLMGLYVEAFVTLFQPLKSDKVTYQWASFSDYALHMAIEFVIIFSICVSITIILPKYFPHYFKPENFNLKKLVFLFVNSVIVIALIFFFINTFFFHVDMSLRWLFSFVIQVIFVNLFLTSGPFLAAYLLVFTYFTQSEQVINDAKQTPFMPVIAPNNSLESTEAPPQYVGTLAPIILNFTDNTNSKKTLQVPLDKLYYITSSQNYVEIFYQNDKAVQTRTILRNSLKFIEEDMIENANLPLIRCHKAFIVNSQKVVELRGPAKMAQFVLEDIDTFVPVSRQKYSDIKPLFDTPVVFS